MVAIPVRDEGERIGACLRALAYQDGRRDHEVFLLLNNCGDDTEAVARRLAPDLPIKTHIIARFFPPDQSNAGHARRTAMACAARLLAPDGILLTTDADSQVPPDWIAGNLAAIANGADLVAGRAIIDPVEARAVPQHLHDDDAVECAYAALLDELDSLLDPDPADPWPRHDEASGASLAVRLDAYHRVGGIPAIPLGEDRAFVAALRRVDARIRHAPDIAVIVSGRLEGRAAGGMADTMRRRAVAQDPTVDDRLEPARDHVRRARLRARFRRAWATGTPDPALSRALAVSRAFLSATLAQPFCGGAWALTEAASPVLRDRRPVARTELPRQHRIARDLRDQLRGIIPAPAPHRSETAAPAVRTPA